MPVGRFRLGRKRGTPLRVTDLDHRDAEEARRIQRLTTAAYRVEGDLLGVADFPPARRTVDSIRTADTRFVALRERDSLLAIAELEETADETLHIAGLTVHPSLFRRGLGGELLRAILERAGARRVTVSTGEENLPAIRLYERHGFRVAEHWTAPGKIAMVTLARDASGGS